MASPDLGLTGLKRQIADGPQNEVTGVAGGVRVGRGKRDAACVVDEPVENPVANGVRDHFGSPPRQRISEAGNRGIWWPTYVGSAPTRQVSSTNLG